MVNFLKTVSGNVWFFAMYFGCIVWQYVAYYLYDVLNDTLAGIVWFGTIICWVLMLIVLPQSFTFMGVRESSEVNNPVLLYVFAIVYPLFFLAVLYFGWFWLEPLKEVLLYDFLVALFYVGIGLQWIMNVVVVPSVAIVEARK